MTRDDIYYEALRTRDPRFDGKFYVGVKTTGIYCRPICPAKPKRENVEFFPSRLDAERAGYRPCLRCRPESAPLSPAWIGTSAVVQRAARLLSAPEALDLDEDRFAERFGVTARHLRRLFISEIGKTPKQLAIENRLNLARKLIVETNLSITDAAFAAGFRSIRRFNDAFKDRFKKPPGEIRRSPLTHKDGLVVSLAYRPPFDFEALLQTYQAHRVGDLEWVENGRLHRIVAFGKAAGRIAVANDPGKSRLLVEIDHPDVAKIPAIIARVRVMFDLDSDPLAIANALEVDAKFKALLAKHAGLRLPSGWDAFEIAVGTILGQVVSVESGRRTTAALIDLLGEPSGIVVAGKTVKLFPPPAALAAADLSALKTTQSKKKTIKAFARAVADGTLSLEPTQDVETFKTAALAIPGIGPWTASYMAMKCLRHTDAFPETDLILARCLEKHPKATITRMSPWRGYAAALLWREYAGKIKKEKGKGKGHAKRLQRD